MNLAKSFEFFDPSKCTDPVNVIGTGSVGSAICEHLARYGITQANLYDFDVIEDHNLANQMFTAEDVGKPKVEVVAARWLKINPDAEDGVRIFPEGWNGQRLEGYVFLCVDNIELRKRIVEENKHNKNIKAMFDCRTSLDTAQTFAADWSNRDQVVAFYDTMDFTHEEAKQNTPVSACNVALCVFSTISAVANAVVTNFVNFVKGEGIIQGMIVRPFAHEILVL